MAAFTVTKSPGFCMAGDRLFLEEGRRPFGFAQGEKKEEGPSASLRVKRRKKEEGIKNVVTVKTVPTTYN